MSINKNIIKLWSLIHKSKKIVLINHIRMDPDAFWSLMGFYYILKKMNKIVKAINDENRPENFNFLDENIFENNLDLKIFNPDLIISFDASSLSQLWNTYIKNEQIFKNKDFIVIDHHITNNWFWKINIINTNSSSTCELIYDILHKLKLNNLIDSHIATLLNTWIITDTNIYYNVNTSVHTMKVVYELKTLWADSRTCIFEFFKKNSFEKTKLLAIALNKIKRNNNNKIIWTKLNNTDYKKTNTLDKDVEGIINMLINIDNSEIAFIIYPLNNGDYKISFRSKSYDVSKLCENFWWWGHKQAAAFSIKEEDINYTKKLIFKNIWTI